jgi:signal transduction histidine kinase
MNKEKIILSDMISRLSNFISQLNIKEDISISISDDLKKEQDDIVFNALNGIQIYRIIQESINNAVKHADAQSIVVNLDSKDDKLNITIKDDGRGFDINQVKSSNGLKNIEKRADKLKAILTINTEIDKGTSINFSFNHKTD